MTETGPPEKRTVFRMDGESLPVEYALKEKADAFRRARAIGVGASDFTLLVEDALSMGALLHLKLYLPKILFPFSNWQPISVEAKVARIDPPSDPSAFHRYGMRITHLSDPDSASLKSYVYLSGWMKEKIKNE